MLLFGLPAALLVAVTESIARLECRVVGHSPDWVLAAALGVTDRPVCRNCRRTLP